jgi:hypothetical protein
MLTINLDNPSQVILSCAVYFIFAAINYCLGNSDWNAKVKNWGDNVAFVAVIVSFLVGIILGVNFIKLIFTTL